MAWNVKHLKCQIFEVVHLSNEIHMLFPAKGKNNNGIRCTWERSPKSCKANVALLALANALHSRTPQLEGEVKCARSPELKDAPSFRVQATSNLISTGKTDAQNQNSRNACGPDQRSQPEALTSYYSQCVGPTANTPHLKESAKMREMWAHRFWKHPNINSRKSTLHSS